MLNQLIEKLKTDQTNWPRFREFFIESEIRARTILLREGEIAKHIYFIKKGCLRLWFNKDGKDVTLQFFFEGQAVASIESLVSNQPGMFTLESVEPSTILSISKENLEYLTEVYPELKEGFQNIMFQRFRNYTKLFLSRIKDSPKERYDDLIKNHPEIVNRVPQRHVASYLGVTPISLSRIKKRK